MIMMMSIVMVNMMNMMTMINAYEPSNGVRYFHRIPHLNKQLHPVDNEFGITSESRWNSYTDSLVPFPVIIGVLGVLIVLIPVIVLVSRYWCQRAKCLPKVVHEYLQTMMTRSPSRNSTFRKVATYRHCALASFIFCLLVVIVMNQGVFFGEISRGQSVNRAKDSLTSLKHTFNDLTNQGYGLKDTGVVIENDLLLAVPTCPDATNAFDPLYVYQEAVQEYLDIVEPLPSRLGDVESYLYYWAVSFRNQMIWLIYGMVWMISGIFIMSILMQSQGSLKFGIGIGFFFTAVLFSLLAALIYLLMMSADFCMNPTPNALGLCEPDYRPVAEYYSSCNGTNPLEEPLETAFVSIEKVDFIVTELSKEGGPCEDNSYLIHCTAMVDYAHGNLTALLQAALCPPVKEDWDEFFHEAVCHDGFEAIFVAWIADYSTIFSVYLTLLVGCLSYQYIGTQWKLDFEDVDEMGGIPSDHSDYYYQRSLDATDRVHSTPFYLNRHSRGGGGGGGSMTEGSPNGRSPVGEYNVLSGYYVDPMSVSVPLLPAHSQDSDESQDLRGEDPYRSSGRYGRDPPVATQVRNSKKLTHDLLPTGYHSKY